MVKEDRKGGYPWWPRCGSWVEGVGGEEEEEKEKDEDEQAM